MQLSILIADDQRPTCEIIKEELQLRGYKSIHIATAPDKALWTVKKHRVDFAIVDVSFTYGGEEGLSLIKDIRRESPSTFIVVLSVIDDRPVIVQAMKNGASDYMVKNDGAIGLEPQLNRAIKHCVATMEKTHLQSLQRRQAPKKTGKLIGTSANIEGIRQSVANAHAKGVRRFVVVGEAGSGKRAVSDYILATDPSNPGLDGSPALVFNCGATTPELARSELFGIAPNSGLPNVPAEGKPGLFELAKGGWVLIDDFQDLPEDAYVAFLQVLDPESGEVKRVSGALSAEVDFKLITTTQRAPEEYTEQIKRRLEVGAVVLKIASLADRREDIPALARHFLADLFRTGQLRHEYAIEDDVLLQLKEQTYKANVGDLRNLVWRLALNAPSETITLETLNAALDTEQISPNSKFTGSLREAERQLIEGALERHNGVVDDAAEELGIQPLALRRKADKHGIPVGRKWRDSRDSQE